LQIVQVHVPDGARTFLTDGYAPTVSPNSQQLAYLTGKNDSKLLVRDLASGATRSIDLAPWIDDSADLFNGRMVWLVGGSTLAVVPADDAISDLSTTPGSHPERAHGCGDRSRSGCVILIAAPRAGPLRYLKRVSVPDLDVINVAAIASDADDQLILATDNGTGTTRIGTLSLADSTASLTTLYSVPGATPEAFDSTGTHIIYSNEHHPPELIAAVIGRRGLLDRRVLVPSAREVQADAW
ncbi:MAG: hypothetical protein WAK93_14100, partial [Solirubrobacteraceae bacterium]